MIFLPSCSLHPYQNLRWIRYIRDLPFTSRPQSYYKVSAPTHRGRRREEPPDFPALRGRYASACTHLVLYMPGLRMKEQMHTRTHVLILIPHPQNRKLLLFWLAAKEPSCQDGVRPPQLACGFRSPLLSRLFLLIRAKSLSKCVKFQT